jgi:hypothetical protein
MACVNLARTTRGRSAKRSARMGAAERAPCACARADSWSARPHYVSRLVVDGVHLPGVTDETMGMGGVAVPAARRSNARGRRPRSSICITAAPARCCRNHTEWAGLRIVHGARTPVLHGRPASRAHRRILLLNLNPAVGAVCAERVGRLKAIAILTPRADQAAARAGGRPSCVARLQTGWTRSSEDHVSETISRHCAQIHAAVYQS